jgi:hypothetical protein
MKHLNRAIALAAALSVAACAAQQTKSSEDRLAQKTAAFRQFYNAALCPVSSKCEVVVTVGQHCDISPDPFIIGIPEEFGAVDITWTISEKSYGNVLFTNDGITFKDKNGEFDNPRPAGKTFKLKDKNPHIAGNQKRELRYAIKVTQDGAPCKLDPTVVNDY